MPVVATQHTADGAQAFAEFFLRTIDWGYATTSSAYMRRYYGSSCESCRIIQLSLDNAQRDRKHYVGGRVTIVGINRPDSRQAAAAETAVRARVNISAVEVVDRHGRASSPEPAYTDYQEAVSLGWVNARWTVVSLKGSRP